MVLALDDTNIQEQIERSIVIDENTQRFLSYFYDRLIVAANEKINEFDRAYLFMFRRMGMITPASVRALLEELGSFENGYLNYITPIVKHISLYLATHHSSFTEVTPYSLVLLCLVSDLRVLPNDTFVREV